MWRDGLRIFNRRYTHELLSESIGQEFDIRYDPRDVSSVWVYGTGGKLICQAKTLGVHPSRQDTEQVISNRQRVKKKLKKEISDKINAAEEFFQKPSIGKISKAKTAEEQESKRRLRKHFHERN
jgi:hypothetical protein